MPKGQAEVSAQEIVERFQEYSTNFGIRIGVRTDPSRDTVGLSVATLNGYDRQQIAPESEN